jgi:prepilin-type N-terminal cleavage/methylation domain-containing protein
MTENSANNQYTIAARRKRETGFTLVELIIVVAILGILAAIVLPEFQGHVQKAKEAAAKDSLRILREAIERYAADHNGIPPGYLNNNATSTPFDLYLYNQLCVDGNYLPQFPTNPFNDLYTIATFSNTASLPANATGNSGWIYKPATKTVKLNWPGTDSQGKKYYDY